MVTLVAVDRASLRLTNERLIIKRRKWIILGEGGGAKTSLSEHLCLCAAASSAGYAFPPPGREGKELSHEIKPNQI